MTRARTIAVALHDVTPETFADCKRIRHWLYDRGIERATLLVVPASGGEPFHARSPDLASWVRGQAAAGDTIAQHGYEHRQRRPARPLVNWRAQRHGAGSAEFAGLDEEETADAVSRGRRILEEADIEANGFVAPAYFYTSALRRQLAHAYEWWADLLAVHATSTRQGKPRRQVAPAACLGTATRTKRILSPALVTALSYLPAALLRLDVHPADFGFDRHIRALERALATARSRTAVSYKDLIAS